MGKPEATAVKVAKITALGAVVVGLIGGAVTFMSALVPKQATEYPGKAQEVSVGRDIVAGGNVSVTVNHYSYLEKEKTPEGFVPPDFDGRLPDSILASQKEPLVVYPTGSGLFEPSVDFIVHSSASANVVVERLYLKIKAYAECEIRDPRHKGTLGDGPDTNLALFVSEKFDVYPLKPMSNDLRKSSWTYKGTDSNNLSIRFYGAPYILYFYTIDIDYFDLSANQKRHTETVELSALVGQQGNRDGCLETQKWYSNDKRRLPAQRSYDEGIAYDVYQLLTADFENDPGLMNLFLANRALTSRLPEVEQVVNSRPDNELFRDNFDKWKLALNPSAQK